MPNRVCEKLPKLLILLPHPPSLDANKAAFQKDAYRPLANHTGGLRPWRGGTVLEKYGPTTPSREQIHRRLFKHYLPATSVADGNKSF